jgi:SAM-dependent methyltransferase
LHARNLTGLLRRHLRLANGYLCVLYAAEKEGNRVMDDIARQKWIGKAQETWDSRAAFWNSRSSANATAADRAVDIDRIWQELGLHPNARMLDAGCGSGQFALALAARGAQVIAVDLSPEMIRLARENAARTERSAATTWQVGSVDRLPLPAGSVDAIHARMVMPFVPDIPAALREFRRVLRPEGRLLVSTAGPLSPIFRESWRRHLHEESGCNFVLPWELELLLQEGKWTVYSGWGEWGADARGNANAAGEPAADDLHMQQATATTWTIIAG